MFETRFASFRLLELALERSLAVERLHDRHARDTDSASCAVTAAMRVRTSENAAWERRWNQRVMRIPGGSTSSATSPSRQSSRKRPPIAATSVSVLTTSVVRPWLRTSESASTSLVSRAMIQPAFCCGEVAERERGQVLEEVAPEVEHHPLTDAGEHQPRRRAEHPRDDADRDVGDDVADEPVVVSGADAVVDRVADDVPAGDRRRRRDRGEQRG